MEIQQVQEIILIINSSQHKALVDNLLNCAVRYSRIRVDWFFSDQKERTDMDEERTIAHNALISNCDILSRNMKQAGENYQWRSQIGYERKSIGDFACLLHAAIGLNSK
jgi:hypothetical protein